MTTPAYKLWGAIMLALTDGAWLSLQELYRRLEPTLALDSEDLRAEVPGSKQRAWQRNVRNVLGARVRKGDLEWMETSALYRLAVTGAPKSEMTTTLQDPVIASRIVVPRQLEPVETFDGAKGGSQAPQRVPTVVQRITRDSALVRSLKDIHRDRCQLCRTRLPLRPNRFYSEVHHLQPLGSPHQGPDIPENMIVVCPNCHAQLDLGLEILHLQSLASENRHRVAGEYVDYHNAIVRSRSAT